ncbi:MAG: response regulator [Verrucomicrobia bacterium]|nr:response regulator [Verrucomicrobiota bacterium]
MQILIAEDDFVSRKLLSTILIDLGYTVIAAVDGEDAWRKFERTPTHIVVSDWLMPNMDGLDLLKKVRNHPKASYTYFIMLTANTALREYYYEAMEAGVDDFMSKPMDRMELVMRLRVAERILQSNLRMQHLEDVLTICAYTKKIKFPEEGWQTIEEFMKRHLGITLTHGIEPDYYDRIIVPQLEALKKQ